MVSALCCIFVIGLIFLLKKQHFFIQRIILYHCLAALFRAIAIILRFHRLGYRSENAAINALCVLSGFTSQLTAWVILMDYSVITFTLLMTAVFHKNVARLEGLYIFLIFVFPLTFNWIPFINNSYGRFGPWCWIRIHNFDDCTDYPLGRTLINILWRIPYYTSVLVIILIYLVVIIVVVRQMCFRRDNKAQKSSTDTLRKVLKEQVLPLLFFPIGALVLNLFPIANGIHDAIYPNDPSFGLTLATAIFSPLQGGYIAVVYTLDRDTLRRLTYSKIVATLCKRKKDVILEYPIESAELCESVGNNNTVDTFYEYWPSQR